jgi:hypothetical protein
MKVFFDTEFTGLHKDTTLISIGLVDENDRTFYAEFTDYDESQCDDWIKENVINKLLLPKPVCLNYNVENTWCNVKGDKLLIQTTLDQWLSKYDAVELVSDCCHYDMVLFVDIFGGAFDLPENVSPVCHDINQDIANHYNISEREAFDKSREDIIGQYRYLVVGDKHNALYDAQVIKAIYEITHNQ